MAGVREKVAPTGVVETFSAKTGFPWQEMLAVQRSSILRQQSFTTMSTSCRACITGLAYKPSGLSDAVRSGDRIFQNAQILDVTKGK